MFLPLLRRMQKELTKNTRDTIPATPRGIPSGMRIRFVALGV
jgi:hypothetical protein